MWLDGTSSKAPSLHRQTLDSHSISTLQATLHCTTTADHGGMLPPPPPPLLPLAAAAWLMVKEHTLAHSVRQYVLERYESYVQREGATVSVDQSECRLCRAWT